MPARRRSISARLLAMALSSGFGLPCEAQSMEAAQPKTTMDSQPTHPNA
jgi:hypothetical protein